MAARLYKSNGSEIWAATLGSNGKDHTLGYELSDVCKLCNEGRRHYQVCTFKHACRKGSSSSSKAKLLWKGHGLVCHRSHAPWSNIQGQRARPLMLSGERYPYVVTHSDQLVSSFTCIVYVLVMTEIHKIK